MKEILSETGEVYKFDEEKGIIICDGVVVPSSKVEPVYSDSLNPNRPPRFSGILFKDTMRILTLSGRISQVVDPNTVL